MKLFSSFFAFLALAFGLTAAAHAEIPAVVGTSMTAVLTDATSLQTTMIPIVVGVMTLGIVISLIKRFGSKI